MPVKSKVKMEFYGKQKIGLIEGRITQGLAATEKPAVSTAQSYAPEDDGDYKRSLGAEAKGAQLAIYSRNKQAPHNHLVEYGTGPREQSSTGRETGAMPAFGVLRKTGGKMKRVAEANIIQRLKEFSS
jgi:hypothetical protein